MNKKSQFWETPTNEIRTEVIDNFLSDEEFEKIRFKIIGGVQESSDFVHQSIEWFYNESVATDDISGDKNKYDFYMTHMIFSWPNGVNSSLYKDVMPIIEKLGPTSIIRIKANLYPNQGTLREHQFHNDFLYPHQGAIFSINTCDGYTLLDDGTKVASIANRMLFLDASKPHASTTTSNTRTRININFNYHKFLKE